MRILKSKTIKFLSCFLSIALLLDQLLVQDLCHAETNEEMIREHGPAPSSLSSDASGLVRTMDATPEPSPPAAPTMNIFNVVQSFHGDPFSGAAVSNIPFTIPPTRMKSGLDLTLSYNSSSNNGICGVGWDLSLPSIQRQTKNGAPNYSTDDVFVLNQGGAFKEFIKVSSSEYRFKIEEPFWKIEFNGAYWICRDKEGTVFRFGYNADTREDGRSGVFKWCLDRITDVHGNYCTITYIKDQGKIYFSQIKYTGNDSTGISPRTEINFTWQARPDVYYSYISGVRVTTAKRLSSIEMKQSSSLVRRYNFSYIQSPSTKRSLIESVILVGSDGSSTLPIARFTYSGQSGSWSADDSRWHAPNGGFIDENGQYNGRQLIDLNGDSWPDFVIARHTDANPWHRATYLNGPSGFSISPNWKPIPKGYFIYYYWDDGRRVLDLTRDGKPEEIAAALWDPYLDPNNPDNPGRFKTAYRHTGQDWIADTAWNLPDNNYFVYGNRIDGGCRFGDLNGDGYNDLIISRTQINWSSRPLDRVAALNASYINTGSGWRRDTKWDLPDGTFVSQTGGFQCKDEGRRLVDINGDGLSDLLIAKAGSKATYLNTGAGWARDDSWNIPDGDFVDSEGRDQGRWLSDVNGDGLVDLLVARNSYKAAYINTGSGWRRDDTWNSPWAFSDSSTGDQAVVLSDLNSDGLTDVMVAKGTTSKAFLNQAGFPDLLTGVDNGIGAKTQITYKPSSYYNNMGIDNIHDLPFIIQTVSQVVVDDGLGNKYTTRYDYYGGMFDGPTREFRGFGHVWVYDTDGNNVETIFYQDEYINSRPYYEKYFDSTGKLRQKKSYNWKIKDLSYGGKFVYLEYLDTLVYGESDYIYKQLKVYNTYDDYGNPTEIINYGDVKDANDDKRVTTEYHYNVNSWLLSFPKHTAVKNNLENIVSEKWFYYDNSANIDALPQKGLLTKEEIWLNTGQKRIATTYGYDIYGNLTSTTNALSHTATVGYDSTYHQFPEQVTNPLGHTQSYTYDAGTGQVLTSTDTNGQPSRNIYDAFRRPSRVYGPNDDANHPGIWYEYDLSKSPVKITTSIREEYNTDISSKIRKAFRFYDGVGRLIQTKTEAEDSSKMVVSDIVSFNTRGEVKDKYLSYFASYSTDYTAPDYSKPKVSFQYDALGRLIRTTSQNESGQNISSTIDYYLLTRTMTDANGHKIKNYYDGHGQLIKVEEYNGSSVYATAYSYDTLGNLTKTVDAQGNTAVITYDSLSRKISMTDPDMGTWTYQYDDLGNLTKQTDAKSQSLEFQYDALNRLIAKKSGALTLANYIYDEAGKLYCKGRLSKVIDRNSATEFFYDNLGREIKSVKTIDANSYMVERTYDALDRLVSLKYPDGEAVNYTYNRTGGIEKVIGNKTYVSNIDYTPPGQVSLINYGNNTHTDYAYNPFTLRLESLKSNDGVLQDLRYQFDNAGNILKITDSRHTATQTFTYDDLDRLISAIGQSYGTKTYKYDSIGNMIEKEGVTFTYGAGPAGPHALTSGSNNLTVTYDANGNMITKNTKRFTYDVENWLTKIDSDEAVEDPGVSTFNLTLKPGWNFVSLPVIPAKAGIQDILSDLTFGTDYDQVSRYNPTKQDFDNYNATSYNQFDTIEYGKGYLVYVPNSNNVSLSVTGKQPVTNQTLQLKSGWNLIGAPSLRGSMVSQALNNLREGVDYNRIVRYNKTTQLFENLAATDILRPGESYYIHCLKDSTWNIPLEPLLKGGMEFVYDGDGGRIKRTIVTPGSGTSSTSIINVTPTDYTGASASSDWTSNPDGSVYALWNSWLDYTVDFGETDSNVTLKLSAKNREGDLGLPSEYTHFEVEAYVDGVYKGLLLIPASTTEYKEGLLALGKFKGTHTIRLKWMNDYWVPGEYDANIKIGGIQFTLDTLIYSTLSTTTYIGSLFEKDSDGTVRKHIYAGSNRIATLSLRGGGADEAIYYHTDHLGSSNVITDSTGTQLQYSEYTPYGSTQVNTGTDVTRYKFTGKELDGEGVYFYGARYYDSDIGRFISADPTIQRPYDPQDLNRYSYCRNNPINLVDPSGLGWFSKIWHKVEQAWDKHIKPIFVSAAIAAAVVFTWGAASGIGGAAALFSKAGATVVASSAATTATLGTGEGRQAVGRIGREFFDDVLGMRPSTARLFANVTSYMALNMGFQFGFARMFGANKAITDIKDVSADPEGAKGLAIEGGGYNQGTSPRVKPTTGELIDAHKLYYSGKELVGVGAEALPIGGQPQHLGLIMRELTMRSDMAAFVNQPIKALSQGYLTFGISHQAVNWTLINAGYGTTINSLLSGGWSTVPSTFVYGPYGGGLTGVVANEQIGK